MEGIADVPSDSKSLGAGGEGGISRSEGEDSKSIDLNGVEIVANLLLHSSENGSWERSVRNAISLMVGMSDIGKTDGALKEVSVDLGQASQWVGKGDGRAIKFFGFNDESGEH